MFVIIIYNIAILFFSFPFFFFNRNNPISKPIKLENRSMYLNKLLEKLFLNNYIGRSNQSSFHKKLEQRRKRKRLEIKRLSGTIVGEEGRKEMKTRRRIKKWKRKKKEGIRVSSWWRVNQTCRKVGPIAGKKAVWPRHHFFQQRQKLLDWCGVESPSPTSYRVVSYKRNLSLGTVPGSKSLQLDGWNLEQPLKSANMAASRSEDIRGWQDANTFG